MKRWVWFILACSVLFSCQGQDASGLLNVRHVYLGEINGKPYALFADSVVTHLPSRREWHSHDEPLHFTGHLLPLSQSSADSVRFSLSLNRRRAVICMNGDTARFTFTVLNVSEDGYDGRMKTTARHNPDSLLSEKKSEFHFSPYQAPEFRTADTRRYQEPLFDVTVKKDIEYGKADGYWCEYSEDEADTRDFVALLAKTGKRNIRTRSLRMDVYMPNNDPLRLRPAIMLIHGGAFLFGSKTDESLVKWCRHLSSMGYVVISPNYRIGFQPDLESIERTGYMALQDAHAAMRYVVAHRNEFRIDTTMLMAGGCSAGAITALNLAYMDDDFRPESSYGKGRKVPDLGPINSSGNKLRQTFSIKAVIDMWGAVYDIRMLDGKDIPIQAFHGDQDKIVPYDHDYPFQAAGPLKKVFFHRMFGSSWIVDRALANGTQAELHTFKGYGHSPHIDENDSINDIFHYIQEHMSSFCYQIATTPRPTLRSSSDDFGRQVYRLTGEKSLSDVFWKVEGGIIVDMQNNRPTVVWISNAPKQRLFVSGTMARGAGFNLAVPDSNP